MVTKTHKHCKRINSVNTGNSVNAVNAINAGYSRSLLAFMLFTPTHNAVNGEKPQKAWDFG